MKNIFTTLFFSILSTAGLTYADTPYECPKEIKTNQSATDIPEGWTALSTDRPRHWLNSVTLFDGPPKDLASLVPDNEEETRLQKVVWSFAKKKERPIWMTCAYSNTDIVFAKQLPLEITQCRILVSKEKIKNPKAIGVACRTF